jgi:hypothetical protein
MKHRDRHSDGWHYWRELKCLRKLPPLAQAWLRERTNAEERGFKLLSASYFFRPPSVGPKRRAVVDWAAKP